MSRRLVTLVFTACGSIPMAVALRMTQGSAATGVEAHQHQGAGTATAVFWSPGGGTGAAARLVDRKLEETFVVGAYGTDECPEDTYPVSSSEVCKQYAELTGVPWTDSPSEQNVAHVGCVKAYHNTSDAVVTWLAPVCTWTLSPTSAPTAEPTPAPPTPNPTPAPAPAPTSQPTPKPTPRNMDLGGPGGPVPGAGGFDPTIADPFGGGILTPQPTRRATSEPTSAPTPQPTRTPEPTPRDMGGPSSDSVKGGDTTPSSQGDPHMINLRDERFDVNQPGAYLLLRVPKQRRTRAHLKLMGSITTVASKPCVHYIVDATVSGTWLRNKSVRVRALRSQTPRMVPTSAGTQDTEGHPFSVLLSAEEGWISLQDFPKEGLNLTEHPKGLKSSVWVSASKTKSARRDDLAGMFTIHVGGAKINVIQKKTDWEFVDIQVLHARALGEDIGGLLGVEAHESWIEEQTAECKSSRHGAKDERPRIHAREDLTGSLYDGESALEPVSHAGARWN